MSEEKTMKIPSESAFGLTKAKLDKDGGLEVHYNVSEVVNEEHYSNEYHVKSAKQVHPDLKTQFEALRNCLARVIHFGTFRTMASTKEFKATAKQLELAQNHFQELLNKIEARGVSFSGQDDNIAVIITGLLEVGNGQKFVFNTPRIKFNTEVYGFETELEEIIGEIETEVYAFLFKGKKAQLELFGSNGEPQEETEDEHNLFSGSDVDTEDDAVSDAEETDSEDTETESEDSDDAVNDDDDAEDLTDREDF